MMPKLKKQSPLGSVGPMRPAVQTPMAQGTEQGMTQRMDKAQRCVLAERTRGLRRFYSRLFQETLPRSGPIAGAGPCPANGAHRIYEQSEHNLCMKSFEAAHVIGSLRQEPLAEHLDFGKRRRRLRTDDPVRVGQSQGHIDWLDQTAVDQIPRRKRGAGQRNTLAVDGGIDQHARTVQNRSRNGGGGDAGGIEPSGPGSSSLRDAAEDISADQLLW